tara:strand:- start:694 stop:1113 length:420 start_codon:yes stop_codon:yes gene_type:complete
MKTYEPIFKIDLTKATKSQFHELFKNFDTKEGVIIKCEAFFIQACQDAGIELSSFILARRHISVRKNNSSIKNKVHSNNEKGFQKISLNSDNLLISSILKKYPEFDPSWEPGVQEKWLDGMIKLYDGLSKSDQNIIDIN